MIFRLLYSITRTKLSSNIDFKKRCLNTSKEFLISRYTLELYFDKVDNIIKSTPTLSLRGGGCVGSKAKIKSQMQNTIPMNYLQTMKLNSQLLVDKCDQLLDNFSRNEIMMSLQWFFDNRYWICEICKNDNLILMLYDLALNQFRQLISVISVYLRGSGCLCYYVLEVCNDLLMIIYTYQLKDEQRVLLVEVHDELLSMIDIIKQDLEVYQNFWTSGLDFQITLIKIVLINSRTNSKEQQDKLISIASSAFSSLLSLSISEDFTNALFDFAKYLLIEKYNQFSYPIQTYQIYYFFFLLKWSIIKNIQEQNVVNKQIANLQLGYQQYVQNSDNWIVHFCWINTVSDLISYRQIISKTIFLKNQDDMKQKQLWNQLIKQNIIQILPYDKQLGKLNNSCSFKSIDYETEQILNGLGLERMKFFQNVIINQKFSNKQNFFQFYVDFTFKKLKKQEEKNNLPPRFELFGVDEQMKKLQRLQQLLQVIKDKISEQYIESQVESSQLPSQDVQTKNNGYNYDLVFNKEGEVQQLEFSLSKLSYLLHEVDFTMIVEKKRIEICYEQVKLYENLNQKDKQNQNQKDQNKEEVQQKQLENIYDGWIKLDFPNKYNQILDQITKLRGFHFKFSKFEKTESKQQQKQIQENDLNLFIRDAQIQIEKFLQELNIQQKLLQNFWRLNNKLTFITNNEQQDLKISEFLVDIIERNKIQFINNEYHKEFKEFLIQQKFQTLEDIQKFDLKIQNYIKMMKILKGQNMQKVYIFSKLEFNLKSTLETKQNKELKQQDNNQQQEISISALILEQKKDIEVLMQKDLKDKNCIDTILEQFVKLRDRIIANFASQQNSLVISALILQTQLYNSFFKLNLSSYQDIEQCKKEILELYQQYDQNQILNNIQYKNTQDQIQAVSNEQNEYLILISENINELNNQIMNINGIIDNMQELSKYVHQNCMGFEFFTEDHFQKHFLDNVKSIIKELIIQLQLDQLLNEFIQNNLDKQQNSGTQIKNKINFTLKDFATIFCYYQITSQTAVQIDKDYQELLDNLEQEMIVERKIYDLSKDYIVRQCFLFHLIKIQSQVPEKELLLLCQEYIKRIWMIEKDESVRAFLKNKEMIEIQKLLFSHDLKTFSSSMKEEMNQKLKELDDIEQAIRFEGNQSKRDELSKQLTNQYEELEEFLDNISEMSQQLDITLIFLKELLKNIKQIKKKIDDLQESINEIGNDVRKLRGKKYDELLLIRKEKVLSQAYLLEVDSVYIPLKTQEINPVTGQVQNTLSGQTFSELLVEEVRQNKIEGREGEVNQFIYDEQQKDVMLIKGQAGSGKSRAARKIEAYLWKQKLDEKDWIPIYISLPQLKNPKFNLLDQTLESENYGFDKLQLKDFKEAISSNKIKLVLILDSYDEMKQDCIQSNLILTNRLIQDLNQVDQIKKVKFIITTRKEILTSLGYQTWFYGESLQTLKEVEIMNFDKQQSENYLKHYVKLSIKRRIKSSYDFVKQIKQQNLDVKEFLEIWNNILDQVDDEDGINENSTMLLTDEQIENILEIIQKQPAFQYVQEDQLIILKKELKDLWSAGLFNKTIENLNIQHFLQTPFMLEIVVQTLPNLSQKYKGSQEIKEMFQKNFLILKSKENLSKKKLSKFIYQEQKKVQIIVEENTYKQSEIEQDQEDQQDLKSLQIILEKLESQHFFEKYSITDISLINNQIINISEDDLKIVIAALKMKIFTIYEFYQNFIEFYHEQQIQKLRQLGKVENVDSFTIDLLQFSESLAIEMTMNQTTQVNYEQKGRLKLKNHYFDQNNEDDWKIQYFDDLEDDYRKVVRSSALINVKGKSYTFNHKSLQEFYVAKHINNLIDKLQFIDNQLTQRSVSYLEKSVFNKKEFNISFENYFGSLRILKENLKLKNENNLKLISIAKLSVNEKLKIASSNSFCLLSYLQVYLGEQDFSGIHIEKTTLKGLSFYKSKFKKSIFNEAIIDSCLFDQANLEEAKWTNMICSEKPLLQGHNGSQEIKEMFQKNFLILKSKENLSKKKLSKFIYQEQKKVQIIVEENTYKQSEIEQDQEDQQDLKSLQIILEKLESQHFFEKYSITDISLINNQIINISEDDLKIVIAALKMKIFTIYEFYQNFIEFYHEQQIQKLRQLGKVENVDSFTIDLLQFSESLAIEMTMNQTTQVNYEQKGRLKLKNHYFDQNNEDDWKIQYFDDLEDDYRKVVRSSALINVKGKSYTFNHKSLQEFYVAKHINNLIDKLQFIDNQLTQRSVSYLEKSVFNKKEFNISFENYFGSLRILKENLKLKNENNLKLISIAKLSVNEKLKIASSNSFCLLSYLQVYLGEQDFSGIHIEKTTLKGLSFYKSKFKKSIFNEAIIDSCLFDQANLEEAKWTNMICSEKPLLQGHNGSVVVIQYSNNGKLIASADSQKVIKFWDVTTFQQEGEISDISGIPKYLVFSDDDQLLFVCSDTNIIETWQISDLKKIIKSSCVINKQEKIIKMQLSQNEKELLAVDLNGLIQFWDINLIKTNFNEKDGFILKSSDSKIKFISFFKNGQMLASLSDDKKVTLWDVIEQKVEAIIDISFPITYLAINQTSEFLVCVSNESESDNLSVWNIQNINYPYLLRNSSKYQINNIQFTTDNQKSIETLQDVILIQNSSNISEQEEYYQIINCTCIDFSPDENLIAISIEKQISLWSLQTNTPITTLENDSLVNELIFIEQGKKLLSGNYYQGVKLWSVEKCQLINFFQISYTQNITISSNYDRMAIKKDGQGLGVVIINLDQLQFNIIDNNGMKVSISQNDQLFVINYNYRGKTQYVINLDNDQQVEFESSKNNFEQCIFSHQSSLFASFNKDQQLQIWTYEGVKFSLKHEKQFDQKISCMIFSFDDKYLAMTSQTDQLIKIWDFSLNSIYTLKESINEVGNYDYQLSPDICFSCDSLQVAFYNSDEIKIWNFLSNQTNSIFKDDNSKVRTIASSPKQNIFATSSEELTIKFWHFETKQLLHSFFTGELTKCLCFTYNGKYLISARNILKLWDISNFPQIKLCAATDSFQGYNVEKICCLHQTQGILCCCSQMSQVIKFDEFNYLGVLQGSDQSKIQCQFSADNLFLVGGIDEKVIIWDNDKNYQIVFTYPFPDIIQSVTYCQDQERLVVTIPSGIYILNIKSTNILEVIPNLKSAFYAKMFQNDKYLFTKEDKSFKIWRNDGDNQFTLIDYYSFQTREKIAFSQDGKYLAKLIDEYYQKQITIYPVDLICKRRFILNNDQSTIRISNNLQYLLYGNYQLSKLSYFESNVTIDEFTELGYFEFSPDNENIVFQNDQNYTLYNIKSKQNISQFSKYKDQQSIYRYSNSYSVQFSNDGKIQYQHMNKQFLLISQTLINLNLSELFKIKQLLLILKHHLNIQLQLQVRILFKQMI
ncbi:unnamed protein product [Paramecium primaurelia]|uniref:NACHT domain-containing protein n=1 Tax=Paramecium primaurelia TaxID=5886 RepID=A0A8S1QG92_PARPR|nr:unnamed protein product [Paramecium primaurelia]